MENEPRSGTDEQKSAALQQQYNKLQADIADMQEQLGTIQAQLQEYVIVDKTLTSISPDHRAGRKCFKMIGGVLVEKTVDEVIKLLDADIKSLQQQRESHEKSVASARTSLESWIKNNHIKIIRQ
ncbi:Cochaperone prefoldin complex subunit [Yamadazyma tenuis]|uniref:Prefoldin n=1 Tax=Candida tenuis (strain ATCC 10573 / BCRC 21748 / CBS 615 / JCM 9827 / NBRC 10315 / NRRL Y-1498 / VKM Y-70) TaxID=590646 RepID=G3BAA0_CANTC|nr:Prefoldin [Yamadazyma tenuis ATCC 10573]EGV61390.1 Prefoldin [Yamadazyma tenuis ATCC 10573]WEJ92608.1 Cochaperone prefoldin complex subunit [Yamadazyma tenuis]